MTTEDDRLKHENARLRQLLAQAGIDAAANDVASKLQKVVIAELHHRVKNPMAVVLSIATQTLRAAKDSQSAEKAVRSRIVALSRALDLVLATELDAASLKQLIENAIEPFAHNGRFIVCVPDIMVCASVPAMALSLVINELCTNAVKYGALSADGGTVDIAGSSLDDPAILTLTWTEKGGPAVTALPARGFGSAVIEATIPDSQVTLSFPAAGVVCEMRVPTASLQ